MEDVNNAMTNCNSAVTESNPESEPVHALRTAMVVDDSALHRTFASWLLRQAGVEVVYEAGDGNEALEMLDMLVLPPALMVIDLEMPTMDGIELLQKLGQRRGRIPLVVCSGRANAMGAIIDALGSALQLALVAVIQKPLTEAALLKAMQTCWSESQPWAGSAVNAPDQVELADALQAGAIRLHYQPQLAMKNGKLVGVEALARWTRDSGHVSGPNQFIPLAERHGLITTLTYSVVDQALEQLRRWRNQGLTLRAAVNLSPLVLNERELVDHLLQRCQHYAVRPEQLVIEITESAVVPNNHIPLGALARLRLKGFGLSIDDYGTGYSALQQLARIPFSELKIDRSFVNGARNDRRSLIMLRSMVQLARQLEMHSVAEGIENAEDWELVRELGCDVGQGYLIAKPMDPMNFDEWFKSYPKVRDALHWVARQAKA